MPASAQTGAHGGRSARVDTLVAPDKRMETVDRRVRRAEIMVHDQEGMSQGIAPDDAGPGRSSPPPLRGAGHLAAPMDEVEAAVAESAGHLAEVGFDTEAAQGSSERLAQRPVNRPDRECRGVTSGEHKRKVEYSFAMRHRTAAAVAHQHRPALLREPQRGRLEPLQAALPPAYHQGALVLPKAEDRQ